MPMPTPAPTRKLKTTYPTEDLLENIMTTNCFIRDAAPSVTEDVAAAVKKEVKSAAATEFRLAVGEEAEIRCKEGADAKARLAVGAEIEDRRVVGARVMHACTDRRDILLADGL